MIDNFKGGPLFMKRLAHEHVQQPWPEKLKYEGYVDQCAKCLRQWPCDVKLLLDMMTNAREVILDLQAELDKSYEEIKRS